MAWALVPAGRLYRLLSLALAVKVGSQSGN